MKHLINFLKRGLMFSVGGPVIVAIVYEALYASGAMGTLTAHEAAFGILTSALLAFIAAGVTVVYEIERLPLMAAIFLHCVILYADYIIIYLANGWIAADRIPLFTAIFLLGYALVWLVIWLSIRASVRRANQSLVPEGES